MTPVLPVEMTLASSEVCVCLKRPNQHPSHRITCFWTYTSDLLLLAYLTAIQQVSSRNNHTFLTAECVIDDDCPVDRTCVNQNCVNPCSYRGPVCGTNAECRAILHRAQCYCPPGMQGNPALACITVGCTSNDDCADDKACDYQNRVCISVCDATTCAPLAECRAGNHAAMCVCPPLLKGNPYFQCYEGDNLFLFYAMNNNVTCVLDLK